jgi:hypothetical protein
LGQGLGQGSAQGLGQGPEQGSADRYTRETRTLHVFAVYDPVDATAFGRVIAAVSVRDNVWLGGSGGIFTDSSTDVLGRLSQRDFLYARLKVFF